MSNSQLLVKGATILDADGPLRVADIRTEDGTITDVGPGLRAGSARVIDADRMVAMPGLINAHTHSAQNLDRGTTPNLPLDLWLMWAVFGKPPITAEDRYTLAMAGALEMLESGCTAVLDHGWVAPWDFEDYSEAIMSAYSDAGMRAGLAPMIGDLDIFDTMSFSGASGPRPEPLGDPFEAEGLLESMARFFNRWQGAHSRLTPMVGPSAPQRCSHELMDGLASLARERDAGFHTHVLETRTQIGANLERYGRSSVSYLEDLGMLRPGSSLAHCVWMDSDEFATVQRCGATIVHNPVSNLRCGSGILPVADLLEGGVSVALGADGAASNDNQNMFEAMKFATLMQTLHGSHLRWPQAPEIWRMCLQGGAAALGQPLGSLQAGSKADIVLLDTERHVPVHAEGLATSLVLAEHGQSVHTVIVDGEPVVSEGRSTRVDESAMAERSRALQRRFHESLPERRAFYDRYVDVLTEIHDYEMARPAPVERLARITPAFGAAE
ncbi:MAG: amidohydrolase [Acidimicrobiaceae bacterium]|nr:amidohydrolase [Acidimicrobiaceae bacterium]MXY11034.1 amidohydrolase [Acidimicrobiaceae bacterium]MXZ64630.1 amidohydrolase [Acidimicrobiaceae bacterium]MYF34639.1 amidohydrolase [Acidimicrobiaceae bacterium]MYG79563.1 amidohydrolase [Acidimicrobiaceae bacterium]